MQALLAKTMETLKQYRRRVLSALVEKSCKWQALPKVASNRISGRSSTRRGFMLLEAAVAIGIVGTATLAALGFVSTAAISTAQSSKETTASWIATSQAEYILEAPYVATGGQYVSVSVPSGFAVSNTTTPFTGGDSAIQNVIIGVSYQGEPAVSIEIVKVNR